MTGRYRQKGETLESSRFERRESTMKKIPDAEKTRRLYLSVKSWYGSAFPDTGLILSFLEYLASNWGRISSCNQQTNSKCDATSQIT